LAVDEAFTSVRVQDVFSLYLFSLPEDVYYDWVINTNRFLLLGNFFSLCYKFFVVMYCSVLLIPNCSNTACSEWNFQSTPSRSELLSEKFGSFSVIMFRLLAVWDYWWWSWEFLWQAERFVWSTDIPINLL